MPDFLSEAVRRRVTLDERYRVSASHQSMAAYLEDWERAYAMLGYRIAELREMRDDRRAEKEAGTWPAPAAAPAPTETHPVVDLVAALEASLAAAKAARPEAPA